MKISVVIPAYNEEDYIAPCLEALIHQTEKPDEIIVVDNNSSDRTVEIAKKYPVRILHCKKRGITPARNAGFNAAKYDLIARIDADTQVPKNWVKKIKKAFQQDPNLIAYSGPTVFVDKRFNKFLAFPERVYLSSFKKIMGHDCLYGPNLVFKKMAWKKVKNEVCANDKIVHEDTDLAIHLGQLGLGKIIFDRTFKVKASERRWKKVLPYIEYPYRYLRTVQHHKQSLHTLKTSTNILAKALPNSKKFMKRAKTTVKYAKALYKAI